jgi:hypothetical protein
MAIEAAGKRYLRTKLASPISTKDRGTLLTVQQAWTTRPSWVKSARSGAIGRRFAR